MRRTIGVLPTALVMSSSAPCIMVFAHTMRGSPGASHTARIDAIARLCTCVIVSGAALGASVGLSGCAYSPPRRTPESRPPPRVLVVSLEQVRLRTSAWVELHAWLAAAARGSRDSGAQGAQGPGPDAPEPEIESAVRDYATVLAKDERDETLWLSTHALAHCVDERCARDALLGTPYAKPFLAALPVFLDKHWTTNAAVARGGLEVARAAIGEELEPLVLRLARDLAIDWPAEGVPVDVVSVAPVAGREAPIPAVMGARGGCFANASANDGTRVQDARVLDCVLAYAAAGTGKRSALAGALAREVSHEEAARAWIAVVVHAAAVTVTGWEPRHVSVLRRSAAAAMPEVMEWLLREWPSRMRGEPAIGFAKRYAAALETKER